MKKTLLDNLRSAFRGWRVSALFFLLIPVFPAVKGAEGIKGTDFRDLPREGWSGIAARAEGLEGEHFAAIGFPVRDAGAVLIDAGEVAAGLYRVRLTVRPSQVSDMSAWQGGLLVTAENGQVLRAADMLALPAMKGETRPEVTWSGMLFHRAHEAETREVEVVATGGRLVLTLSAHVDTRAFDTMSVFASTGPAPGKAGAALRGGGDMSPRPGGGAVGGGADDDEGMDPELRDLTIGPKTHFYYLVDRVELAPVSTAAMVEGVTPDRIRYLPGATVKAAIALRRFGNAPVRGTLRVWYEYGLDKTVGEHTQEVTLDRERMTVPVELAVPGHGGMGHALIAEFVPENGAGAARGAEYFNVTDDFHRTAIYATMGNAFRLSHIDEEKRLHERYEDVRAKYGNAIEFFSWGEEDMVGLSPERDWWFSGQSAYFLRKKGLQDAIRVAQGHGIAMISYGKFTLSGYIGWKEAFDYPFDHKNQCQTAMGMSAKVNIPTLDKFKYGEILPASPFKDSLLSGAWGGCTVFLPIDPDDSPRNVRAAAEAMIRSARMFGWDGVRWDGHPRGGNLYAGAIGGSKTGNYNRAQAEKTRMLVRYFKDIVNTELPGFGHGYNYFFTQSKVDTEWAVEDFELDELCEGGGMLMNESIRKCIGFRHDQLAANIQTQGDLVRERGGHLLLMSNDAANARDVLVETILYFAGGAHPMLAASENATVNRFATRHSDLVFGERRRLAKPEAVLEPTKETTLWWTPFVYETDGKEGPAYVVHLLNIDPAAKLTGTGGNATAYTLRPATEPTAFRLAFPAPRQVRRVVLLDPVSLTRATLPIQDGVVTVPSVKLWSVLVIETDAPANTPSLAKALGPTPTLGRVRDNTGKPVPPTDNEDYRRLMNPQNEIGPDAGQAPIPLTLTPTITLATTERVPPLSITLSAAKAAAYSERYFPDTNPSWWREAAELPGLSPADRETALAARMTQKSAAPDPKSPAGQDLALAAKRTPRADAAPERNGRMDVHFVRGVMDERLHLHEALARIPRFSLAESWFTGGGIDGAPLGAGTLDDLDVAVFCDISHPAIGTQRAYDLADFVRAGGAAYFTGGEWSFGKGLYQHTVLDRELLPVRIVANLDARYATDPLVLEPGADFAELGLDADWSAKPRIWCWNETALRPDAPVKVFVTAGNRPILVGWQVGEGRVACWLAHLRGKSTAEATAFFDWNDWPSLNAAVLTWLSPDHTAMRPRPDATISEEELTRFRKAMSALEDAADLDDLLGGDEPDSSPLGGGMTRPGGKNRSLPKGELDTRIAMIRRLLPVDTDEAATLHAGQLTSVGNLPEGLRFPMLATVLRRLPHDLAETATRALADGDERIRNMGFLLAAVSAPDAFATAYAAPKGPFDADPVSRGRYRAMGLALYTDARLVPTGKARLRDMNAREKAVRTRFAQNIDGGVVADMAPGLVDEELFERIGLLAYLARHEPEEHAGQFALEWAMIAQYRDFCDRNLHSIWTTIAWLKPDASAAERQRLQDERARTVRLKDLLAHFAVLTRPLLEERVRSHPKAVIGGFGHARYALAAKEGISLLGHFTPDETEGMLRTLSESKQPDLGAFARARLADRPAR